MVSEQVVIYSDLINIYYICVINLGVEEIFPTMDPNECSRCFAYRWYSNLLEDRAQKHSGYAFEFQQWRRELTRAGACQSVIDWYQEQENIHSSLYEVNVCIRENLQELWEQVHEEHQ